MNLFDSIRLFCQAPPDPRGDLFVAALRPREFPVSPHLNSEEKKE